ncbi:coiled-coil domain-containing protein 84 protein [Cladochytrium replicatum]|nr:coiled-coil domain-containing protein 84 protein [Cladochytrium replicatum]
MGDLFCGVCRRNDVGKGRSHARTRGHQEKVSALMERQKEKLEKLKTFLRDVIIVSDSVQQPVIWCMFCDLSVRAQKDQFSEIACAHIFQHFGSKAHYKKLVEFLRRNFVGKDRAVQYMVSKEELAEFHSKSEKAVEEGRLAKSRSVAKHSETLLVQPSVRPPESRKPMILTIISPLGVKQNPTGRDENGARVWGGGIIKLSTSQWKPWDVELDTENEDWSPERALKGQKQLPMGNWSIRTGGMLDHSGGGTSKYTVKAFGKGLSSIERRPLQPGQKTVHDETAVPPWLQVDDVTESQPAKTSREIGVDVEAFWRTKNVSDPASDDPAWLPRFGGLWSDKR